MPQPPKRAFSRTACCLSCGLTVLGGFLIIGDVSVSKLSDLELVPRVWHGSVDEPFADAEAEAEADAKVEAALSQAKSKRPREEEHSSKPKEGAPAPAAAPQHNHAPSAASSSGSSSPSASSSAAAKPPSPSPAAAAPTPPPPPPPPPKVDKKPIPPGEYTPKKMVVHAECKAQGANFGNINTLEECDRLAAGMDDCGEGFMFSEEHPDWQCRCCTEGMSKGGPHSENWDVYEVQNPRSTASTSEDGIYKKGRECGAQAINFGQVPSPKLCSWMVAQTPECGDYFMFSKAHPEWACRCCSPNGGQDNGLSAPVWNVYKLFTERPKVVDPLPTAPPVPHASAGLPIASDPRPSWLEREDDLVIDARNPPGHGGILILQAVLADARADWGKGGLRPHWLRAILATNRDHARRHGHVMVLRSQPTQPQLTKWQWRNCFMKDFEKCVKENERENFNWEKHLMMRDYMLSSQKFTHILMLDADAALVNKDHDTLRQIAAIMDEKGKDVFLTDEDWLEHGTGRINGGLMFNKVTPFTVNLYQDTFDAHLKGSARLQNWRIGVPDMECSSNEQICLNDLWTGRGKEWFAPKAMMASGLIYNRGAERGGEKYIDDPSVEVMHWMGGSKASAGRALCDGPRDFT
eukprot:CAMPEP_0206584590 /NCGR_PEP_ID=MMETSP0325_2-20121206/35833_1 /ASSEMBLY_ACC=CAM_ASM_000347 /TAXON_ID=2866 /ORGANISM="Crypthecodinium cohnii, Strain Seligo" /LENGTH=634 /DNA_ID=CAMNT_0054091817 /DNA_START=197 /DNA_END=2098 /DNA_ORIENTATION=+